MCQLFETIRVEDGEICNLSYHQLRVSRSSGIGLFEYINSSVTIPAVGLYKLRIDYTELVICGHSIDLYAPKKIESLKCVVDDEIDYHKKFADRTCFENLLAERGECDDILIIKNGMVTDISFANILFFDEDRWITSDSPLLEGSCRARLIEQNKIVAQRIMVEDLGRFSKFMIVNAMLDFDTQRSFKIEQLSTKM